jgi:uncharacterized glyoxalase superfamily protein PhnB
MLKAKYAKFSADRGVITMKIGSQVYVKGSAEAVALYIKAFGAVLDYHVQNDDGSFYHAELFSDGEFFLAVSEAFVNTPEGLAQVGELLRAVSSTSAVWPAALPTMQFGVDFKDESGVLNAFEVLKPGATVTLPVGRLPWSDCCASLVDKFGVSWYFTIPQHKPEE